MQLSLDNLKRLDPKDIGNWPIPVQLAIFFGISVVVVVLGYFLILESQTLELEAGRVREEELKTAFLEKKKKAVNLDAYTQQLREIQDTFGALLKQLPTKGEMETLITEVNQAGVGRGLQFDLFEPNKAGEIRTNEYAELPINIKVEGSYHDLAAFSSDIAQLSRIVTLSQVFLLPAAGAPSAANASIANSGPLTLQAVVQTYRALDPEEAVALKKAETDKKKARQ